MYVTSLLTSCNSHICDNIKCHLLCCHLLSTHFINFSCLFQSSYQRTFLQNISHLGWVQHSFCCHSTLFLVFILHVTNMVSTLAWLSGSGVNSMQRRFTIRPITLNIKSYTSYKTFYLASQHDTVNSHITSTVFVH